MGLSRKFLGILALFLFTNTLCVYASGGNPEPPWVNDPYTLYSKDRYIAAVGFAPDRAGAENKALAELAAIFGQSVLSEFSVTAAYSEAAVKGIVAVQDNIVIQDSIVRAASFDTLIGAEIGNVWDNGRGTVYAVSFLERNKTIAAYTEMIQSNLRIIENLIAISADQKNTFDAYVRYKLAAVVSNITSKYANIVYQAGGPAVSSWNMESENSLNMEALEIIRNITVAVNVKGDRSNRIRDAFSRALSGEGLRTMGNDFRYTLNATVNMSEDIRPNSDYKYCSYTVSVELIENATASVLFPFSFTDREGHTTYEGAESRAILAMERTINEKYPLIFREYLAALLPRG